MEGWYAIKIIQDIPPGLSKLYNHMMTRIENRKMSNPQYYKNVLVATSLAYRPLFLSALVFNLNYPIGRLKMAEAIGLDASIIGIAGAGIQTITVLTKFGTQPLRSITLSSATQLRQFGSMEAKV